MVNCIIAQCRYRRKCDHRLGMRKMHFPQEHFYVYKQKDTYIGIFSKQTKGVAMFLFRVTFIFQKLKLLFVRI